MTSQPIECPSEPSPSEQDLFNFQAWIDQVRQQNQRRPDFEEWASQVKAQMLSSLRKRAKS